MSDPFVGEIRMFGFWRTPTGWQPCDGRLLEIAEFDVLYTLLGTTFGGDGQTTFAVPDMRGRLPVHQGQGPGLSNQVLGQRSGVESVTLQSTQIPPHTHAVVAAASPATSATPSASSVPAAISGDTFYTSSVAGLTTLPAGPSAVSVSGGGQAHENSMPTLTVNFFIAAYGLFPQQN